MTKPANVRKHLSYTFGAARFWGNCIELLDAGKYHELRALFVEKAKARVADVDRLEAVVKKMEVPS